MNEKMVTRSQSRNINPPLPEDNTTNSKEEIQVNKKYGDSNNSHDPVITKDGVKLEVGKEYTIEQDYEALEDVELTVKKGDKVQIMSFSDNWILCKHSVETIGRNISNWSEATDMTDAEAKNSKEGFVPKNRFDKSVEVKNNVSDSVRRPQESVGMNVEVMNNVTDCMRTLQESLRMNAHLLGEKVGSWLPNQNWVFLVLGFLVAIVAVIYFIWPDYPSVLSFFLNGESKKSCCNKSCIDVELKNLENQYPDLSNNLWNTLGYCLRKSISSDEPCIILLLNGSLKNYRSLLKEIGKLSVKLHICDSSKTDIIYLRGSSLSKSDSDDFYRDNKCKLEENKVMLVDELEHVPSSIMKQFHAFCDIYDPAVKQAVIVFLFNHRNVKVNYTKNDATFASALFEELWKGSIHHDIINPLAMRVSENIVRLE